MKIKRTFSFLIYGIMLVYNTQAQTITFNVDLTNPAVPAITNNLTGFGASNSDVSTFNLANIKAITIAVAGTGTGLDPNKMSFALIVHDKNGKISNRSMSPTGAISATGGRFKIGDPCCEDRVTGIPENPSDFL